jgi:hypothetical protein
MQTNEELTPWGHKISNRPRQTEQHKALEHHAARCIAAIQATREQAKNAEHMAYLDKAEKHFANMWSWGFNASPTTGEYAIFGQQADAIIAGKAHIPDFSTPTPPATANADSAPTPAEIAANRATAEARAKIASDLELYSMWKDAFFKARAGVDQFTNAAIVTAALTERSNRGGGTIKDIHFGWTCSALSSLPSPPAKSTATATPKAGAPAGPPAQPATKDQTARKAWARATAEWEAEHQPELTKGFSSKQNYVAYRTQEILGKARVYGGTTVTRPTR